MGARETYAEADAPETVFAFSPGLPGGTRPARKFLPLPRRKSPPPWNAAAVEAHYTRMRSVAGFNAALGRKGRGYWGPHLAALHVGASMVETGDRRQIRTIVGRWGSRLGVRFVTRTIRRVDDGTWEVQITRVDVEQGTAAGNGGTGA